MSREIKFRAWDKWLKKMYYTDWKSFRNWYNESVGGKVALRRGVQYEDFNLSEPMQYTGLKDKNGQEIYEGDIIENSYGKIMPVVYVDGCFRTPFKQSNYRLGGWKQETITVIGNIYEHSNLLNPLIK